MRIKRIAIIGLGLIGGSLAKAIKHYSPNTFVAAFDYPEVLQKATTDKNIDIPLSSIKDSLEYELIFLCLPIDRSIEVFKELSLSLKKNQIISDLCSVKGGFSNVWGEIKSEGSYIGAHPMTGNEKGGYANSDNLLFENSCFIISESSKKCGQLKDYIELVKQIGGRVAFLDPYLHDEIVAKVSHLPQLLSVLLVNQAAITKNGVQFLDFAAGGFRDMTRTASSDINIWESILKFNKKEVLDAVDLLQKDLREIKTLFSEENSNSIGKLFENARSARDETPINNKGFLDPLFDITVFIKDEPGMISKISTVLFENEINIKDIELLKIRTGTGGNFKLYFESKVEADEAKKILESIGFNTN